MPIPTEVSLDASPMNVQGGLSLANSPLNASKDLRSICLTPSESLDQSISLAENLNNADMSLDEFSVSYQPIIRPSYLKYSEFKEARGIGALR